jgi:hypothetical protein
MFVLDVEGRVVHEFHGLPGGRSGAAGRSDHRAELQKARAKLGLPEANQQHLDRAPAGLPDLKPLASGAPAGVRLFIRQEDPRNTVFSKVPVVEVVPMRAGDWKPLSFPSQGTEVAAEVLERWLVWLYPAGIRAADEQKRFQEFHGTLTLEPAGTDGTSRVALLRGTIRLAKGGDAESAFEGELEAVLTYGPDQPEVRSVRGIVEGNYLYRARGTTSQRLRAVIESRPD